MYGPEVPAGRTRGFRVPPPHGGGCQGGYGGVWLSLSFDSLDGPVTDTVKVRAVGVRWDGSTFPLWKGQEDIWVPKTAAAIGLPEGIASVSITNWGDIKGADGVVRHNSDVVVTTMIEAETRGVPAK